MTRFLLVPAEPTEAMERAALKIGHHRRRTVNRIANEVTAANAAGAVRLADVPGLRETLTRALFEDGRSPLYVPWEEMYEAQRLAWRNKADRTLAALQRTLDGEAK